MLKRFFALALLFTISCLAFAARKPFASPIASQLSGEFQGRSFRTKIPLGNTVLAFSQSSGLNKLRLIDTELSEDGTVKYYVRRGFSDGTDVFTAGGYIDSDRLTGVIPAGTEVWVNKVELKDDRIELWLSKSYANSNAVEDYAKLKLMLGRDFASWEYDRILQVAARALVIERLERVMRLEAQYTQLKSQLPRAEAAYSSSRDPLDRYDAANHLKALYGELINNRVQLTSLGRTENESAGFKVKVTALEAEMATLKEAARQQRIAKLQDSARSTLKEATTLKADVARRKPATFPEWENKKSAVSHLKDLYANVETTYSALQSAGQSPTAEELAALKRNQAEADAMFAGLDADKGRMELRNLDQKFAAMQAKRSQLEAAYMKSFGTAQERSAMQALADHLRQMRENRLAAERAGNKQAALQAAALAKDLEKFR